MAAHGHSPRGCSHRADVATTCPAHPIHPKHHVFSILDVAAARPLRQMQPQPSQQKLDALLALGSSSSDHAALSQQQQQQRPSIFARLFQGNCTPSSSSSPAREAPLGRDRDALLYCLTFLGYNRRWGPRRVRWLTLLGLERGGEGEVEAAEHAFSEVERQVVSWPPVAGMKMRSQ
jgi:hypothetical protein